MKNDHKIIKIILEDILAFCNKIIRYKKEIDEESFKKNELVIDAVLRNLELIGEASSRLPEEFKNEYSDLPWRKIVGLRNIVIHNYSNVDINIIWDIITINIPELTKNIREIYNKVFDNSNQF
ncbi:MAG: DUF86 domain-containing protein [Candidatus Lokiarchaeota archaeon]|nr:DUF86 domain-containing protein [Candidatus Lokiarchaeota archaeon]